VSVTTRLGRPWPRPRRRTLAALAAVCLVEALALGAYVRVSPGGVTAPRYLLYPFVWLNVAGLAVLGTRVFPAPARRVRTAAAVAVGYFLVLAAIDGTVALSPGTPTGVAVHWGLPPGWGPLVVADLGPVRVAPVPYRTLGYAAVAYLLYATVRETASGVLGGVVGLFSCVSCTLPVVAALLSGVGGGSAAAAATTFSHDLSTAVFLATVVALAWVARRNVED
jgi:hypothetical protein